MKYRLEMKLADGWQSRSYSDCNEFGQEEYHLEASHSDGSFMDICFGEMPDGESAQDQAFENYAESVGFSDDDPEDFNPIVRFKFDGKSAWGFDAYQEDDAPMRLISQEIRQGMLVVIVFGAPDRDRLVEVHQLIERGLRVL
ncbi:MAG: hypothetical protein MJY65_04900 [Bacteroidaceae bacterium]|nr:hypothetical protein [Bacteroidaceae bacterium]